VLWTAKNRDAELHLADQVAGNNAFETTQCLTAPERDGPQPTPSFGASPSRLRASA
jgi:hypothetical protein